MNDLAGYERAAPLLLLLLLLRLVMGKTRLGVMGYSSAGAGLAGGCRGRLCDGRRCRRRCGLEGLIRRLGGGIDIKGAQGVGEVEAHNGVAEGGQGVVGLLVARASRGLVLLEDLDG